jgi:hypothetical protein
MLGKRTDFVLIYCSNIFLFSVNPTYCYYLAVVVSLTCTFSNAIQHPSIQSLLTNASQGVYAFLIFHYNV